MISKHFPSLEVGKQELKALIDFHFKEADRTNFDQRVYHEERAKKLIKLKEGWTWKR